MALNVQISAEVSNTALLQELLPGAVAVGIGKDTVVFRTQRNGRAVAVGVVETEPSLEHVPISLHLGEHAREAWVAGGAAGVLRLSIIYDTQGLGAGDLVE